ncbi:MAG: TetR/AcrR family transcriptional regulator [Nocardia sp.]|nr:TetR/AcrR family transcriptional regulator [Nocardia sp.]
MAAGLHELIDHPDRVLDRGLRVEDTINAAGASQATFYRRFPTKGAFLDAILDEVLVPEACSEPRVRAQAREALAANGNLTGAMVRSLVGTYFTVLTEEASLARNLMARSFSRSNPRAAQAVREAYRGRDAVALAVLEESFERSGAVLRKPFTAKTLTMAMVAVVEGFQLRYRADPGSVTPEVVADTLLALLAGAAEVDDGHRHLDDVVAAVDRTPAPDAAAPKPLPRDPRAAVIRAARAEFGKRGYVLAQLEVIAENAGLPLETVRRFFPNKALIIVGGLRSAMDALREGVADDLMLGLEETAIVENHLLRCAQLFADETPFMDALVMSAAHDTYGEPEGLVSIKEHLDLPAIIAPVIEQGQRNGTFTCGQPPMELAAGLTNLMLLRCFARRTQSPEANAAFVGEILLYGMVDR